MAGSDEEVVGWAAAEAAGGGGGGGGCGDVGERGCGWEDAPAVMRACSATLCTTGGGTMSARCCAGGVHSEASRPAERRANAAGAALGAAAGAEAGAHGAQG